MIVFKFVIFFNQTLYVIRSSVSLNDEECCDFFD